MKIQKRSIFILSLLTGVILAYPLFPSVINAQTPRNANQQSNFSQATISLQDLPPGFIEIPSENLAPIANILNQKGVKVEKMSLFIYPQNREFLMIATMTLSPEAKKAGYSLEQVDFRQLMGPMMLGSRQVGEIEVLEQKELSDLNNIGDSSTGMTTLARMRGMTVRTDMATFRRNEVLAFTLVTYPKGDAPVVQVGNVARELDTRIQKYSR